MEMRLLRRENQHGIDDRNSHERNQRPQRLSKWLARPIRRPEHDWHHRHRGFLRKQRQQEQPEGRCVSEARAALRLEPMDPGVECEQCEEKHQQFRHRRVPNHGLLMPFVHREKSGGGNGQTPAHDAPSAKGCDQERINDVQGDALGLKGI
jgi:hypothetical protein